MMSQQRASSVWMLIQSETPLPLEVQGGYDWLLAQTHCLDQKDCGTLLAIARELQQHLAEVAEPRTSAASQFLNEMQTLLDQHIFVPTALGLRASSLTHKVAAWLHAVCLESKKVDDVVAMLKSIVSVTSDMGVELGITHFALKNVELVLPSWMAGCGVIDNGDGDEAPRALTLDGHLLEGAIPIPGMMHIVTNVLTDMHSSLHDWDRFVARLHPLMQLLCHKPRRERFIQRCIRQSGHAHTETLFAKNLVQYHDKRWFSIVRFLQQLEPLLGPLALTWSEQAYLQGHSGVDGEDNIGKFSVAAVSTSVRDGWLHSYMAMILMLDSVPEELGRWSEGCDCHETLRCIRSSAPPALKRQRLLHADDGSPCPMMGKRAAALASGKHLQCIDDVAKLAPAELWAKAGGALQEPGQWMSLLADFHRGCGHLRAQLQLKLQFWSLLPWRLCALALPNEDDARAAGRLCVQQYQAMEAAPASSHHKVTLRFMTGEVREELDHWIQGASLLTCPRLQVEIAKLGLIPVCERIIEARGSQVSHSLGAARGPVRASLSLRLPELKWSTRMSTRQPSEEHGEDDQLKSYVLAWQRARCIERAAHDIHLAAHPEVAPVLARAGHMCRTALFSLLGKVLYHCDLTSQFGADLREAAREHSYFGKVRSDQAQAVLNLFHAAPPAHVVSEELIFEISFLAHARSHVFVAGAGPDIFSAEITDAQALESLPRALVCGALSDAGVQPVDLGPVDVGDAPTRYDSLPLLQDCGAFGTRSAECNLA